MVSVLFDLMHIKISLVDSMLTVKKIFPKICFLLISHIFIVNVVIYADKILRCLFDSIIATLLDFCTVPYNCCAANFLCHTIQSDLFSVFQVTK